MTPAEDPPGPAEDLAARLREAAAAEPDQDLASLLSEAAGYVTADTEHPESFACAVFHGPLGEPLNS